MNDVAKQTAWAKFWNQGRWWKAATLVVAYFILFQAVSFSMAPFLSSIGDSGTASFTFVLYVIPILLGGVILVIFGLSVGWFRALFAKQTPSGKWWMWIAIVVVVVFNVLHMLSIDYSAAGLDYVMTWMLAGLMIGFAEEVLTRGYVVRIMRSAGQPEIVVALVSSALFALMHAGNLLGGQPLFNTSVQLVYTFFFGVLMYLALRVTGTLIAPILLHASTDPSIFMPLEYPLGGTIASLAGFGNFAVIGFGLVLVFFIRGRLNTKGHPMDLGKPLT